MLTNKGGVDLGIQRQPGQAGWNAFNYPSSTASGQGKLIADSRGVHHVYFRVSTGTGGPIAGCAGPTCDIVKATFSYRNSADVQIDYDERVYAKPSPTFFDRDANGRLKLRFLRFMSLLPNGGASSASRDIADGAYITNARFTQLRLWNAAATTPNWVPWNAARIEHAWSVQVGCLRSWLQLC